MLKEVKKGFYAKEDVDRILEQKQKLIDELIAGLDEILKFLRNNNDK